MNIDDLKASVSRKEVEKTAKEAEFHVIQVLPWPGDGWYRGTIRDVKNYGHSLGVDVDIYGLEIASNYYGPKKGWIRPHTTGDDITAWFFDALGNPSDPKETIGKTCSVYVMKQFSKSRNQFYDNVVAFAELPSEDDKLDVLD